MSASAALQKQEFKQHAEPAAPVSAAPVSAARDTQRVAITRRELELYVRDGRPTGLLFSAVAKLKGMSPEEISRRSGVAPALVAAVFSDGAHSDLKIAAIQSVAGALGIDLSQLRLAEGQVHIFDLTGEVGEAGPSGLGVYARGVALLLRDAFVIRVEPSQASGARKGRFLEYHAAQHAGARAIFVNSRMPVLGRRFNPALIPSARWACGTQEKSKLHLGSRELSTQLVLRDLNRLEFDQLFTGEDKATWVDVKDAARSMNVSRSEIIEMIRARSSVANTRKRTRAERRAQLRVVGEQVK